MRASPVARWRPYVFNVSMGALVAVTALVAGPALIVLPKERTRSVARWWARTNLKLLKAIVGITLEIRGREHIPQGAALIAVKHQSALETFALMPELPDPAFVLKRELLELPLFGWFLKRIGVIAVNRAAGSKALGDLLVQSQKATALGRQVVIFPEGTRRPIGAPPDYKSGVALLYKRLNVACVPVAINTGVFWPKNAPVWRRGRAVIEFLEPIPPGLDRHVFERLLRSRIEQASAALVAEAQGSQEALASLSLD
jgi:1-acyl-sn-glycerol-3-phosphate acyltransferase